jgi:hypothetical protein
VCLLVDADVVAEDEVDFRLEALVVPAEPVADDPGLAQRMPDGRERRRDRDLEKLLFALGRLVHGNPNECGPGSLPGRWLVRA